MNVLVVNCGSSSIKAAVLDDRSAAVVSKLKVERLGSGEACWRIDNGESVRCEPTHEDALVAALPALIEGCESIGAVGHRVVHGGTKFKAPVRITDDVVVEIESLSALAPLHNPANAAGIRAARKLLPELLHIAVFDTAFHATLPRRAWTYGIDNELATKHSVRRYGFHGTSHQYVAKRAAAYMDDDLRDLRIITCHLGNGCSVCAVEYGRSVETSMGMTPLEGLVMGTRSGDVDVGAVLHMARAEGWGLDEIDRFLNRSCGLAGLSGNGNDLRDIEARAGEGDEGCRLAIQVFAHRVRKYIGAYAAAMGGVDAIVFTAGIGENSALMRHRIATRLEFLGARFCEDSNGDVCVNAQSPVAEISEAGSRCRLLVVATDEQHAIAGAAARLAHEDDRVKNPRSIPVAVSARHMHITRDTLDLLFGKGHELTPDRPLSQPGQYASVERVKLIGPRNSIDRVRILGPIRSKNQIEISRTDEFSLGVDAPVRASGDVANSPGIIVEGPAGRVELKEGVICAWRHIHMTPDDARHFGVKDRDVVEVAVTGTGRDLIFGDVLVRVSPKYKLEMHIDTDEGNAAELSHGAEGALVETEGVARLQSRKVRYD